LEVFVFIFVQGRRRGSASDILGVSSVQEAGTHITTGSRGCLLWTPVRMEQHLKAAVLLYSRELVNQKRARELGIEVGALYHFRPLAIRKKQTNHEGEGSIGGGVIDIEKGQWVVAS
jgi:hypothetical protein